MNENIPHAPLKSGVFLGAPEKETNEKTKDSFVRVLRTMKSDMSDAIKGQNETLVSIALAEEKKEKELREKKAEKPAEPAAQPLAPKPRNRFVLVIAAIVTIGLVTAAGWFILPQLDNLLALLLPKKDPTTTETPIFMDTDPDTRPVAIPSIPLAPSLIPAQSEKRITLGMNEYNAVLRTISGERISGLTVGEIKNVYISEDVAQPNGEKAPTEISANRMVIISGVWAPEILTRSLERSFMVGFLGEEGSVATPFVVFKLSGYDTGLAGMIAWEKEGALARFMDTVFGTNLERTLEAAKFHNVTLDGKDVRIAESKGTALAYAFAGNNAVVIAASKTTIAKILPLVK